MTTKKKATAKAAARDAARADFTNEFQRMCRLENEYGLVDAGRPE